MATKVKLTELSAANQRERADFAVAENAQLKESLAAAQKIVSKVKNGYSMLEQYHLNYSDLIFGDCILGEGSFGE